MALAPGSQVGKYRLGKLLGEGGFGCVYAAHDTDLDRRVALKFLKAEHATAPMVVQRFLQEGRSAARIVHPGIVTIYECGELAQADADGVAFIAMELLDGESLTARLARATRLGAPTVLEIGRQLASALEAAHRGGVVHRDLKPDNVFLVPDATTVGGWRVKVLDFGIAKVRDKTPSAVQTASAMVFGTPRYMSPEQCVSAASVDHRSDIYTLGCILFELLAGRPPFEGTAGELVAFHMLMPPPDLLSLAHDAPRALAALVEQMLAKQPADRPASMVDVQRALEACGAVPAGQAPTLPPDGRLAVALPSDTMIEPRRTPTTLSGAAGASQVAPPRRSQWHVYAIAAAIAIIVPVVIVAMLVSSGSGDAPSRPASAAVAEPARPEAPTRAAAVTRPTAKRARDPVAADAPVAPDTAAPAPAALAGPPVKMAPRSIGKPAARPAQVVAPIESFQVTSGAAAPVAKPGMAPRPEPAKPEPRDAAPVAKPRPEPAKPEPKLGTRPEPAKPEPKLGTRPESAKPRDAAKPGTRPEPAKPAPRDATIAPAVKANSGRDATIDPFAPESP